uniref:WH1 domain-containing protein n=1 Tax=Anopheles epiroticus TaxID=199890 RepID=A0A182PNC2_9DIPT
MFSEVGRGGDHDSDEEEFFKPTPSNSGKSTLAKIFGITPKATASSNERDRSLPVAPKSVKISERYGPSNFRYVPAEPAEDDTMDDAAKTPDWTIVRASVVTAYKLIDGDNVFLGKLGLALLNSSTGHRLLLYRTKTDVLGTVTLASDTKLFLKQDYLQFRADDSNEFWSVLFESESDRQALLAAIESWCCVEREPIVEEPLSEVERDVPEPSKSKRSELAARMARMGGQAMPLPEKAKPPPIPTAAPGSDSSDTSDSKIETISTRPIRRPNFTSSIGMQMVPLAGMIPTSNVGSVSGQSTATMADVNFNLVMSENRMQNTEMRMNLTKLESKLDRVLDRIDLLSLHQGTNAERPATVADKDAEVLELEEKLLELKRANHALKGKVRTLEAAEREGTREANTKLEEKLKTLEELERRQQESISTLQSQLTASHTEAIRQKEKIETLEKQLTEQTLTIEGKTKELKLTLEQLEEARRVRASLNGLLEEEKQRSEKVHLQLEQLQKDFDELQKELQQRQPAPSSSASLVKDIMNGCYQQLCDQIADPHVLRIIAQTIKRETKAALEREGAQ